MAERLRSQLPTVPTNAFMVLDGQQRIQSLFLAFAGRYDTKGVYLKIDELAKDGELLYRFEYLSDLEAAADKSYVSLAELANVKLPDIETFTRVRCQQPKKREADYSTEGQIR